MASVTASGGISPPAPSLPGTNQLIILGGGDYTIPAAPGGSNYSPPCWVSQGR